ncbi:MAG: hypothetical protein A4E19_12235 [Nitrospira sp. SG-bin1]|nr:MAG: hypothetical protein A4E19_12235 [Nitrospira sp. SG-bin1]
MKVRRQPVHLVLAALYRDGAPKILEQFERAHGDLGQAVVWLVGLASTLLVLAVANPEKVETIAGAHYVLLCGLLLSTIASGVLCRLLALWALGFGRGVMFNLGSHMAGYVTGYGFDHVEPLSDQWDEQEIVRRLQDDFGLDYSFLHAYQVPLAEYRNSYKRQYELWEHHEADGKESMAVLVGAHLGMSEKKAKRLFEPTNLTSIRTKAYLFKGLSIAAEVLLVVASASFVAAMFLVALGLIRLTQS